MNADAHPQNRQPLRITMLTHFFARSAARRDARSRQSPVPASTMPGSAVPGSTEQAGSDGMPVASPIRSGQTTPAQSSVPTTLADAEPQ